MLAHEIEFPYSHDLDGLIGLCERNGIKMPEDLSGVGRLSVFAVRLRYDASPAARLDRDQALKWAASAVAWARDIVEDTAGRKGGDSNPRQRLHP
jgi:hypothetical protein